MITFEPAVAPPRAGTLIYRAGEYSLVTEPNPGSFTALLVNDVHIEVDEDGTALSVWGLCPHPSWIPRNLTPPAAVEGGLRAAGAALVPGVGIRLNPGARWSVFVDRACGWLCAGEPDAPPGEAVRFAPGAVAVLRDGRLVALWIRPAQLPR